MYLTSRQICPVLLLILFLPAFQTAAAAVDTTPETSPNHNASAINHPDPDPDLVPLIRNLATPVERFSDLGALLEEINGQRLVLMGESTHGTTEFYRWRGKLSRYLIKERGFRFIAVEGDWPGIYEINRYVKDLDGAADSAEEALEAIERWPLWLWRNREVKEFVEWLRDYNDTLAAEERIGFYGIDLYAYEAAMNSVVGYLEKNDPELAIQAADAYDCMPDFSELRNYLDMVARQNEHCGSNMNLVLALLQDHRPELHPADSVAFFEAEQKARMAVNAEEHFRANLQSGPESWNRRASHFHSTARELLDFYGEGSRGIVWAHNSHIGDARATNLGETGMINIGQLAREELGSDAVYSIGFGTFSGRVIAAREWDGPMEMMRVAEAREDSWEALLDRTRMARLLLLFSDEELSGALADAIPHRAIGVNYVPEQDAQNNYIDSILPRHYNAFLFLHTTGTLDPLD